MNQSAILQMQLYQHVNVMLEIVAFRLNKISFNFRISFISNINSLYATSAQRTEVSHLLRHPQIYIK